MSCNPEPKGLLRTWRFPALRVAGLCIGFLLLPTNIGSGAHCSRALLQHYIEPKDTYNFTYIHPLRNSPYIIDYNLTWSLTTTCSTNSTWTSTSLAATFWTLSTAWTTSMPSATDGPTTISSTTGMEMQKDTYIPVFTNRPQDCREWRQRINLYRRKLELQNKSKEAVLNVLTSLHGVAWRQLEPKVETILAKEDGGFDLILAELDATFRYNEDVEMPRAFERFFYGLNRKARPDAHGLCCRPSRSST